MPRKKKTNRQKLQRVSVRAERSDEVDWDKFAWALLQHARILSANQRAGGKTKGQSQP
jgi:hypothetical protein